MKLEETLELALKGSERVEERFKSPEGGKVKTEEELRLAEEG